MVADNQPPGDDPRINAISVYAAIVRLMDGATPDEVGNPLAPGLVSGDLDELNQFLEASGVSGYQRWHPARVLAVGNWTLSDEILMAPVVEVGILPEHIGPSRTAIGDMFPPVNGGDRFNNLIMMTCHGSVLFRLSH